MKASRDLSPSDGALQGCQPQSPASAAGAESPVDGDPYDYGDGDEFGPDSEDEDAWDDCGLMPDGQCTKAGSEECDWDCGRLHRRG